MRAKPASCLKWQEETIKKEIMQVMEEPTSFVGFPEWTNLFTKHEYEMK